MGGNFDNFWARFFGFSIPTKKIAKQKHDLCMRKWWDRAENNNRNILAPGNPWFSFFPYSTFRGLFPAVLQNFVCPRRASPLWLLKVHTGLETAVTKVCIFQYRVKLLILLSCPHFCWLKHGQTAIIDYRQWLWVWEIIKHIQSVGALDAHGWLAGDGKVLWGSQLERMHGGKQIWFLRFANIFQTWETLATEPPLKINMSEKKQLGYVTCQEENRWEPPMVILWMLNHPVYVVLFYIWLFGCISICWVSPCLYYVSVGLAHRAYPSWRLEKIKITHVAMTPCWRRCFSVV